MNERNKMLIAIVAFILMILVIGTTQAFFNYTRTGGSNTVKVGRISFLSRQTERINLSNLFPIDPTVTGIKDDDTKVGTLEIEIEGDTDYSEGVEYLISSVDSNITTNGKTLPISLDVIVTNLGTENDNYWTVRNGKNSTIYQKLVGDTLEGDQQILVGYIKPNTTSGTAEGVNGSITIKAYFDENKILITDTLEDGPIEVNGYTNGTQNSNDKVVLTTTEWNALQSSGASFKVKVEANQGIWVEEPVTAYGQITGDVDTTTQISFASNSTNSNGKGLNILSGTENDSYPIYYYRGAVDDNNVVFAGYCWQMVRTTETGGIKMIYNGEPVVTGSGANIIYDCGSTRPVGHIGGIKTTTDLSQSTGYYYADDYEITNVSGTTITYRLKSKVNPITQVPITSSNANTNIPTIVSDYPYTCKKTTDTGTCTTLYKVDSLSSETTANVYLSTQRSSIGDSRFNTNASSLSDVGYMYNTRYENNQKKGTLSEIMLSSASLNPNYWYANSVTWGSPTVSKYNLKNPYKVSSTSDYPNLVGKYTFGNTSMTYTNILVYYIAAVDGSTMYYILLQNGNNLSYYTDNTYTYGDGYTDNHDNTYTITDTNSVTTINRSDWYSNYSNLTNKYVCKNATNNTCSEVWYVTSTSNTGMTYTGVTDIMFSNAISNYDEATNTYTLDSTSAVSFRDITDSTNKTSLNNAHYTCWNETGTCQTLSYIHYLNGSTYYYIDLTNGEEIEDVLYKMTGNGDAVTKAQNSSYVLNQNDSLIKELIESWFRTNLTSEVDTNNPDYSVYLEDTVYCNDRSFKTVVGSTNYSTFLESGWNKGGGSLSKDFYFGTWNRYYNNWYSTTNIPTIVCPNETDRFTVSSSNGNGALTYPVGLLTVDEIVMAGEAGSSNSLGNKSFYLYTGAGYWSLSPCNSSLYGVTGLGMSSAGNIGTYYAYNANGLRPVVSLKFGVEFETGGTGTTTNPYVVKYE